MPQQLVFEFMVQIYDIFTDSERPLNADDVATFTEVYKAYARVRYAVKHCNPALLAWELDNIHKDLIRRINSESARS